MKNMDYFAYLVDEIHSVIAATTDENGLPVTCAIDIMTGMKTDCIFSRQRARTFTGA